ncbi:MAG: hypothetical protein QM642_12055 [Edaphocola sp.]
MSYEQFLFLGKCACNDLVKYQISYPFGSIENAVKKNNIPTNNSMFWKNYAWLNYMHFPLPSLFSQDSLKNTFEQHTLKLLDEKYKTLRSRSEKYHIKQAPELICESIYKNTHNNIKIYIKYINENKNYIIFDDKIIKNEELIKHYIGILKQYLKQDRYNNNGW